MQPFSGLFDKPESTMERMFHQVEKVILGKRETIVHVFAAMLCGGHVLLEDVPGVGKTMLARTVARTLGCECKRIQCTPDLLPTDITGVSIYNPKTTEFEFRPGPLFSSVVLVDELNRTSPKTQSALLEAMEEKRVTVDGVSYVLPDPFIILATQNPLECEGTFALPEAQLDRFMMKLTLGYPNMQQEKKMLDGLLDKPPLEQLKPVIIQDEFLELQKTASHIHVDDTLKDYIVRITAGTRQHKELYLGASPRASYALMRAAQAIALIEGRRYVVPDDIRGLILPVLSHRLLLTSEARIAGKTAANILEDLLTSLPLPILRFVSRKQGSYENLV
jgi:MoxR-like ATPase